MINYKCIQECRCEIGSCVRLHGPGLISDRNSLTSPLPARANQDIALQRQHENTSKEQLSTSATAHHPQSVRMHSTWYP